MAENAEVLASLAGGHDASSELFLYFTKLHIQGSGLVDAAERTPMVAHIVERLATLRDLAQYAKGSRLNCMQLDAFGQDIMRAFDFHGARQAAWPTLLTTGQDHGTVLCRSWGKYLGLGNLTLTHGSAANTCSCPLRSPSGTHGGAHSAQLYITHAVHDESGSCFPVNMSQLFTSVVIHGTPGNSSSADFVKRDDVI